MPVVPFTGRQQLLTGRAPSPSETDILMALADMHGQGRLLTVKTERPDAERAAGNKRSPSPLR